ncbi:hypothetical protein QTO34_003773 [Cnephaeus nilssonii]|uniref:G-protein coupled receptors family 1 profile domain-containing protein n=1 Tax=Cnephaeus nilssonii TaxID=3371016 RepID=A0AA40HR81_CNENI|nr:hypothetical protein QTO34_003773 [Eptesicus nilssonii]
MAPNCSPACLIAPNHLCLSPCGFVQKVVWKDIRKPHKCRKHRSYNRPSSITGLQNLCEFLNSWELLKTHTCQKVNLNLSFLEIGFNLVIVPKMLGTLIIQDTTISFLGCATQMYFFFFFGAAECCLLATMAYDRYVAICDPLRYPVIMGRRACAQLAAASWFSGFPVATVQTTWIFSFPFCGPNRVNHFFCDSPPVIALVCADTSLFELEALTATVLFILFPFLLILGSYVRILSTIFRMPSAEGKRKAFSTCSSHLLVVSLFYSTAILTYFRPRSSTSPENKKLLSLSYTVVTPMLNPIIYSLRNSEVKAALKRVTHRTLGPKKLAPDCERAQAGLRTPPPPLPECANFMYHSAKCALLAVMSYDRYVAVCKPLHYSTIMTQQVCLQLAVASWVSGALVSLVDTTFTFQLPYRGQNIINHYFCEPPALLKLASADTYSTEMAIFAMGVVILLAPVSLILVSYWHIISTVVQMQSGEGRLKAFSTCGSHLIVVVLFYGSGIFTYMRPNSKTTKERDKMISVFYTWSWVPVRWCTRPFRSLRLNGGF